jgi:hypothetical protein
MTCVARRKSRPAGRRLSEAEAEAVRPAEAAEAAEASRVEVAGRAAAAAVAFALLCLGGDVAVGVADGSGNPGHLAAVDDAGGRLCGRVAQGQTGQAARFRTSKGFTPTSPSSGEVLYSNYLS